MKYGKKLKGTWLARAFAMAAALASPAAHGLEVRVTSQQAIAPKWIPGPERVAGICPDVMAAVERIEPRLRFTGYRRSGSLPVIEAGLESGRLDAACGLIASPRRMAISLRAGSPVYVVRYLLAARSSDDALVDSVGDLLRLKALVTSQRGSVFTERLKAAGVRVDDATDDNRVNLHKLLAGHGRFTFMNELALGYYVRADGLQARVRVLPVVLAEETSYFWVSRKADPALAPLLAAALDRLKASGELARIYTRWAKRPPREESPGRAPEVRPEVGPKIRPG
jgi:glutamate/aspartate transport system substrate-binding protein